MPDRYRYQLPDGQTFETEGLAKLRKAHPDATITHRVVDDGFGQAILVPFEGKASAEEPAQEPAPSEEPEKSETKRAAKKAEAR